MQLVNLDLNLLLSLDALLQERGVTRAAQRLGLSQPTLSAALARLRRHFNDELLTRVGNNYQLTPLAVQLRQRASVALAGVERVFTTFSSFDPMTSDREFTILASDYAMAVVGKQLSALLAERGPAMRLRLEQHDTERIEQAHDALRTVDGIILPYGFLNDLPRLDLFEDSWMCLVAADNPEVGDELTLANLSELPWVYTYHGPSSFTPAGKQLQMLGIEPKIQLVIESFLALPSVIAHSNRLGMIQGHLVPELTKSGEVRALPPPYEAVKLVEAFWWHPIHDPDAEHAWLRSLIVEAGRRVARTMAT